MRSAQDFCSGVLLLLRWRRRPPDLAQQVLRPRAAARSSVFSLRGGDGLVVVIELFDSAFVPAALGFRIEPDVQTLHDHLPTGETLAEADDVRMVVLTAEACGVR